MGTLVTGATGFIGRQLLKSLAQPVILSRSPERATRALGDIPVFHWEPEAGPPPAEAFAGIDAVINLAGEPIAEGRWTATKKQRIRDSRVLGTRHLVQAIAALPQRPRVLVSASAIGYYGPRADDTLDETAAAGNNFLADVCRQWEAEANRASSLGVRVVTPRTGMVLGKNGGALAKMVPIFKLGLGGPLGTGSHWMSWIHVEDLIGLLLHAIEQEGISGAMNAVAPNPVTNHAFTRALASALRRPAILPAPYLALRMLFGEVADMLFASQRVVPRVAERTGYCYRYPQLAEALQAVLAAPHRCCPHP